MATIQLSKHKTTIASNFISKEDYKAGMDLIQKRIDRIVKVQKAKNWKNNLTK